MNTIILEDLPEQIEFNCEWQPTSTTPVAVNRFRQKMINSEKTEKEGQKHESIIDFKMPTVYEARYPIFNQIFANDLNDSDCSDSDFENDLCQVEETSPIHYEYIDPENLETNSEENKEISISQDTNEEEKEQIEFYFLESPPKQEIKEKGFKLESMDPDSFVQLLNYSKLDFSQAVSETGFTFTIEDDPPKIIVKNQERNRPNTGYRGSFNRGGRGGNNRRFPNRGGRGGHSSEGGRQ